MESLQKIFGKKSEELLIPDEARDQILNFVKTLSIDEEKDKKEFFDTTALNIEECHKLMSEISNLKKEFSNDTVSIVEGIKTCIKDILKTPRRIDTCCK